MSLKMLGIDVFEAPSTTPKHELGLEVFDPRGGEKTLSYTWYPNGQATPVTVTTKFAPGATYKYVKATGTIAAKNAVKLDLTTLSEADANVVNSAAADEVWEGIAMMAMSSGQYGWICVKGRVYDANVADAATAGANLGPTATAGRLGALVASAANALAAATGVAARALEDGDGNNLADILLS